MLRRINLENSRAFLGEFMMRTLDTSIDASPPHRFDTLHIDGLELLVTFSSSLACLLFELRLVIVVFAMLLAQD